MRSWGYCNVPVIHQTFVKNSGTSPLPRYRGREANEFLFYHMNQSTHSATQSRHFVAGEPLLPGPLIRRPVKAPGGKGPTGNNRRIRTVSAAYSSVFQMKKGGSRSGNLSCCWHNRTDLQDLWRPAVAAFFEKPPTFIDGHSDVKYADQWTIY